MKCDSIRCATVGKEMIEAHKKTVQTKISDIWREMQRSFESCERMAEVPEITDLKAFESSKTKPTAAWSLASQSMLPLFDWLNESNGQKMEATLRFEKERSFASVCLQVFQTDFHTTMFTDKENVQAGTVSAVLMFSGRRLCRNSLCFLLLRVFGSSFCCSAFIAGPAAADPFAEA